MWHINCFLKGRTFLLGVYMENIFEDRRQAGRILAEHIKLTDSEKSNTLILALPRGGVPIAFEIAKVLKCPLDVLVVRKIGHPENAEYGIGAIVENGYYWLDPDASTTNISSAVIEYVIDREKKELKRRVAKYRDHELPSLAGKNVILVDDGIATGVTARVAAKFVKSQGAKSVTLAVPVCLVESAKKLRKEIDQVICVNEPAFFLGISHFYNKFDQTSDEEVLDLLARSRGIQSIEVEIPNEEGIKTHGTLTIPDNPKALVIFAHGSGSSRFSPRNQEVAAVLNKAGIGTLLFDLLTEAESNDRKNIFDIPFLGIRLISATRWIKQQELAKNLAIGYFGASTGAAAALWAAGELNNEISAIVSRGGRPDLAMDRLYEVTAPTLLIVGEEDKLVIRLNQKAYEELVNAKISLIPHATHLFEEPGALEQVSMEATEWFIKYCVDKAQDRTEEEMPPHYLNNVLHFKKPSDGKGLIR